MNEFDRSVDRTEFLATLLTVRELRVQLAAAKVIIAALTVEKEAIYAALTDEGPAVIYRVTKRVLNARHVSPPACFGKSAIFLDGSPGGRYEQIYAKVGYLDHP
jgi:hypothetical protein